MNNQSYEWAMTDVKKNLKKSNNKISITFLRKPLYKWSEKFNVYWRRNITSFKIYVKIKQRKKKKTAKKLGQDIVLKTA